MYALIEYKGKQYKAEKDALIRVDKINIEQGQTLDIDTVVFVNDGTNISVGAPYVKGAMVQAVIEDTFKDKKVIVYKFKSKKDYHRTIGHRQRYTNIRITGITVGGVAPKVAATPKAAAAPKAKPVAEKTADTPKKLAPVAE